MKLTEAQQKKLLDRLGELWKNQNQACLLCSSNNWSLSDTILELREYNQSTFVVGGAGITPLIVISCNTCGNTILVNAIRLGLIDPTTGGPTNG